MSFDNSQSKEIDLDRTDRLPILEGVTIEEDVADDSVRLDYAGAHGPVIATHSVPDTTRQSGIDLPSLAESVRSVEERIARQSADYEALNRQYEKAREAQMSASTRAEVLAAELGAAQSVLAVDQNRLREMERVLAESNAAAEATRLRVEEALRESERSQAEAKTLRESLSSRDAAIAKALHSLGERDAQLSALQKQHAQIVPALEARSLAGAQLQSELNATRERGEALAHELKSTRQSLSEVMGRLTGNESDLVESRRELGAARSLAESYLENLRSKDWRNHFHQNLFREWDDKIQEAHSGQSALQAQHDRLQAAAESLRAKNAELGETIAKLQAAAGADAATSAQRAQELQESQRARNDLQKRVDALQAERAKTVASLNSKIAEHDESIAKLRAAAAADAAMLTTKAQELKESERSRTEFQKQAEALQTELAQSTASLNAKLAEHDETIARLRSAATVDSDAAAAKVLELRDNENKRNELQQRIDALETQRTGIEKELQTRTQELRDAQAQSAAEVLRVKDLLAAAEAKHGELYAQLEHLRSDAATHEEEMTVVLAHLSEARRPIETIQAEVKRLNDELAAKTAAIEQVSEDNRNLRSSLERTRGALEERELLIRRLERNASNNANALGRLQTSIERLGAPPTTSGSPTPANEFVAELIRLDGDHHTLYLLGRRTRVGRAPGCELQIDSQSVSRNHAVLLKGPRDLIVEDLNSTNGVLVNGRKISRHLLSDGDVLTIGESQFRCVLKTGQRPAEAPLEGEPPANAAGSAPASRFERAAESAIPEMAAPATESGKSTGDRSDGEA